MHETLSVMLLMEEMLPSVKVSGDMNSSFIMQKFISNDKYYSRVFICKQGRMKYGYINQPTFNANGIASALCNVPLSGRQQSIDFGFITRSFVIAHDTLTHLVMQFSIEVMDCSPISLMECWNLFDLQTTWYLHGQKKIQTYHDINNVIVWKHR